MKRDCVCPRVQHQHGTWRAYRSDDCRCDQCRAAWADYNRHYRTRQHIHGDLCVPSTGTALRLQALAANGWSASALSTRLGVKPFMVQTWRIARSQTVHVHTRNRVAALYDDLWDKQPPAGRGSARCRTDALRRGWVPPLMLDDDALDNMHTFFINPARDENADDIDPVAVERAMSGERMPLTKAELSHAIDRLTGMGYSADMTAARLGVSDRLVQRYRAKGRAA